MSIELLPPDEKYPNVYHVRSNWCNCHPETCCCNDWAVHGPDGEKHSTHFHEETADALCVALNQNHQIKALITLISPVAKRKVLTDDITAGADGASDEFSAGFDAGLRVGETDFARDILKFLGAT